MLRLAFRSTATVAISMITSLALCATIVVPAPPGGSSDTVARVLAQKFGTGGDDPTIVLNKPGGNLVPGAVFVVNSLPDGKTLLLIGSGVAAANKVLLRNLPYEPETDLPPVGRIVLIPVMLAINSAQPVKSYGELISFAKANPGKLNAGVASPMNRIALERFMELAGIKFSVIPYPGAAAVSLALVKGEIDIAFQEASSLAQFAQSGSIRALAVNPAIESSPLPALKSLLPKYDIEIWLGMYTSKGTPPQLLGKLTAELNRVITLPEISDKLRSLGYVPLGRESGDDMKKIIRQETEYIRGLSTRVDLNIQ